MEPGRAVSELAPAVGRSPRAAFAGPCPVLAACPGRAGPRQRSPRLAGPCRGRARELLRPRPGRRVRRRAGSRPGSRSGDGKGRGGSGRSAGRGRRAPGRAARRGRPAARRVLGAYLKCLFWCWGEASSGFNCGFSYSNRSRRCP